MPVERRSHRPPQRNTRRLPIAPPDPQYGLHTPSPTWEPSTREPSNEKRHVSWSRNVVRGPSAAYSRNRTPPKSAILRQPASVAESVHSSSEATLDPASEQLWAEEVNSGGHHNASNVHVKARGSQHSSTSESNASAQNQSIFFNRLGRISNEQTFATQNPLSRTKRSLLELADDEDQRDEEVCRRVHMLRAQIVDFALEFICTMPKRNTGMQDFVGELCGNVNNLQLIRYIGWLALAGPKGVESWQGILADDQSLQAVIVGIIGAVLKQHVFSELWFGGTRGDTDELERLQQKQKDRDGYERTKSRAEYCNGIKDTSNVAAAETNISQALTLLLAPLFNLGQMARSALPESLSTKLHNLVMVAGRLSREMRQCGDVIYHWPPTFKDEEFDPERMECLNIASMIRDSPYEKRNVNGHDRSVLKGATERTEAIVQVFAFPGLAVHRKGGGALAKYLLQKEEEDDKNKNYPPDVQRSRRMGPNGRDTCTGEEGFRTRVICKSIVHLIWGKQRLLTKEAGTSAHLDAMRDSKMQKYDDDSKGCVELFDHFLKMNPGAV